MENKTYTVSDVARIMHMTERTIRNYLKEGILRGTRVGGQWRFSKEDLDDLIQNSTFRKQVRDNASMIAKNYIDRKVAILGDITICSVIDYKNPNQEYMDKVQETIKNKDLQQYMKMLGNRNDISVLLRKANAFILPSLYEGMPLVLIEAQASGVPCVASDTVPEEVNVTGDVEFLSLQMELPV